MPNSYFKYKQFTVHHDRCAMKVCTDASLFGALIDSVGARRMLDIGTGSGLLSLMAVQKDPNLSVTAIDIDKGAAEQAEENFSASPWPENFRMIHQDVKEYASNTTQPFDLIISNPPFFERNLKGRDRHKNLARHDDALNFEQLAGVVKSLLTDNGKFWVILPPFEFDKLTDFLQPDLSLELVWNVFDRPGTAMTRKIGMFAGGAKSVQSGAVYIKDSDGSYSEEFSKLLKDYYLIF